MVNMIVHGRVTKAKYEVPVDQIKGVQILKTGVRLILTEKVGFSVLAIADEDKYDAIDTLETYEELEEQYQRLVQ